MIHVRHTLCQLGHRKGSLVFNGKDRLDALAFDLVAGHRHGHAAHPLHLLDLHETVAEPLPPAVLASARSADYVTFKYRVRFAQPEKLDISGPEAARIQERLKTLGIKHEYADRKNEMGQIQRATFLLTGPFPCQAVLRADYDEPGFNVELVNVRHHGPAKLRLGPDELNDDVLDEFGTWVLGADESFERFLKRRA